MYYVYSPNVYSAARFAQAPPVNPRRRRVLQFAQAPPVDPLLCVYYVCCLVYV